MRGNRGNQSNRPICDIEDKNFFPRVFAKYAARGYPGYSGYSLC